MKRYTEEPDLLFSETLREKVTTLADEYYVRTGKQLHVTSGLRTPARQAAAMYDNEKNKRGVKYAKADLYNEVIAVFRAGFERQRYTAAQTIADMTAVIEEQCVKGNFLSAHLTGRAVDLRKDADGTVLAEVCREAGHFYMAEQHCHHITFA